MALPDATHLALIETYIPASPTLLCWRWWLPWLQPLFGLRLMQTLLNGVRLGTAFIRQFAVEEGWDERERGDRLTMRRGIVSQAKPP
jgi:hypothetical protein